MRNGKPATRSQYIGLLLLVVVLGFFVGSCMGLRGGGPRGGEEAARAAALTAGGEYGVDPALVVAVMRKESGFDARAKGKAGEIGLMQIMPATGKEWAEMEGVRFRAKHLYDPLTNARAGAWYLREGLDRWDGRADPLPYALARYNAGNSRVVAWDRKAGARSGTRRFVDAIDIPTTKRYVEDILLDYRGYLEAPR